MTNTSKNPLTVVKQGKEYRLDTYAYNVSTKGGIAGMASLRGASAVVPGRDGSIYTPGRKRDEGAALLSMWAQDGDVDGNRIGDPYVVWRKNMDFLLWLFDTSNNRVELREYINGFASARTNLLTNPSFRGSTGTIETRRNYCTDPEALDTAKWANYTGVASIAATAAGAYGGSTGLVVTAAAGATTPRISNAGAQQLNFAVGDVITLQAKIRPASGTGWNAGAVPFFLLRGPLTAGGEWTTGSMNASTVLTGGWILASITATIPAGATGATILNIGMNNVVAAVGTEVFHVDQIMVEKAGGALNYFTGSTATDADGWSHGWSGAVNSSESIRYALNIPSGNLVPYAPIVGGAVPSASKARFTYRGGLAFSLWAFQNTIPAAATAGDRFATKMEMRAVGGTALRVSPRIGEYNVGAFVKNLTDGNFAVTLPSDGSWVSVSVPNVDSLSTTGNTPRMMLYQAQTGGYASIPAGSSVEVRNVILEKVSAAGQEAGAYFDGATASTESTQYVWSGTTDASTSILSSRYRRATVEVRDAIDPEILGRFFGEFKVPCYINETFWEDSLEQTWASPKDAASIATHTLTPFAGSTAPITDAEITVFGPANNPILTDPVTGHSIQFNGNVPNGQSWVLDSKNFTSKVNGVSVTANTVAKGRFAPRYFGISAAEGAPTIQFSATGTGAATGIQVKARRKTH